MLNVERGRDDLGYMPAGQPESTGAGSFVAFDPPEWEV